MYITRSLIVAETRAWIGTPYRHQASLKGVGCDCLGLVRGVWRATIGDEPECAPPYAPDWAEAASGEPLAEAAARHLVAVDRDARWWLGAGMTVINQKTPLPNLLVGVAGRLGVELPRFGVSTGTVEL